jgi:hypothetical protein
MSTIRVGSFGTIEDRVANLEQATNYEETILCVTALNDLSQSVPGTTFTDCGGLTIPWYQYQELLPDDRWAISGSGWLASTGAAVTLRLSYQKDDVSEVVLEQQSVPAASGYRKIGIGPYAARGELAPTVPKGESIPSYKFSAALNVADPAAAVLFRWTLWLRMTPRRV